MPEVGRTDVGTSSEGGQGREALWQRRRRRRRQVLKAWTSERRGALTLLNACQHGRRLLRNTPDNYDDQWLQRRRMISPTNRPTVADIPRFILQRGPNALLRCGFSHPVPCILSCKAIHEILVLQCSCIVVALHLCGPLKSENGLLSVPQ